MYLSEVKTKQATARVVAFSVSKETGEDIITYELEYPRLVHSELMTHRLFSRNGASSRAIPVTKVIEMVENNPAMPARFGANQAGMQDKGVDHDTLMEIVNVKDGEVRIATAREAWVEASRVACVYAEMFNDAGYHKQVGNRLLEPFQFIKVVVTFTGKGNNFFGLRLHEDADPTIFDLANAMDQARSLLNPKVLQSGDWHMPYYKDGAFIKGRDYGLQKALKISSSCCAQVSYRKLDDSNEKAELVYNRLVGSKPVHASPFEHQATPLKKRVGFRNKFVTHIDRNGDLWSGNFKNWGQHRQIIDGNVIAD